MLKNLKPLREQAGITQKQLADAVSVSQQSINKYENHNIEPDIETMIQIADFFHVSVDYLIGHSVPEFPVLDSREVFSESEKQLLARYRLLTHKQQACLLRLTDTFLWP